jgi:hypothetical protein
LLLPCDWRCNFVWLGKARATTKGHTVSAGARASASRCHYFRLMHETRSPSGG